MTKGHQVQSFHTKNGFTIVELLIVIVVIGILAAISIVAFNGVTNKAKLASLQSDTANAAKSIESYRATDASSAYPASLADARFTAGSGNTATYTRTAGGYCLQITNSAGTYNVNETGQSKPGSCTITNLVVNPSLEVDSSNWYPRWFGSNGNGTLTRSSDGAKCGTQGLRKQWTVSGGYQDIGYGYKPVAVTEGRSIAASVSLRASFATTSRLWVEWADANGNTISTTNDAKNFNTSYQMNANEWKTLSFVVTAPTNAKSAEIIWGPYPLDNQTGIGVNIPVGATLDTDCLIVSESGSTVGFADGNSNGWTWTGTANQSTSKGPAL